MNFPTKKVMPRFLFIIVCFGLIGAAIIGKAAYTMFVQRSYWEVVQARLVKTDMPMLAARGNIISADGQLLASSISEYYLNLDFLARDNDSVRTAKAQHRRDSVFLEKIDSMSEGLHAIFSDKSTSWFHERLEKGFKKRISCTKEVDGKTITYKTRVSSWRIYPKRVTYMQYRAVKTLPIFRESGNKGGFCTEKFTKRMKPFGSLAMRTLGDFSKEKDAPYCGLELSFDSVLRGKNGVRHRQKVMNKYLDIIDVAPIDGLDIQTTIDVNMQDVCEKALVDKLTEINARVGVVILMEVATGDIKALVNMERCADGEYRELQTHAISDLLEPGSVFKPVSFLVAFNDGKIKMTDGVDTGCGIRDMYGEKMKDHNWHRGGYGYLTVPACLQYSSNVGVSYFIDKYYSQNPQAFVDGVMKTGIGMDLKLPIPGYVAPRIRGPRERGERWAKTDLPWMSIGYVTQIPPINTLTFYNGIANNGRAVKPRIVKNVMNKGDVVREYPTEVLVDKMASPEAVKHLQDCLESVVSIGLGKKAGSKHFKVSGKTGTAQIWTKAGFASNYLVSFAGYYPSDNPKYSCIVCIQKPAPASGGGQCGPVFAKIAEAVMSSELKLNIAQARDTVYSHLPFVKNGNMAAAHQVLSQLAVNYTINWDKETAITHVWGSAQNENAEVVLQHHTPALEFVPSVEGMGARDAVFLLEKIGLKVRMKGVGRVVKQSIKAGEKRVKGRSITLLLESKNNKNTSVERPTAASKTAVGDSLKKDSARAQKADSSKQIKATSKTKIKKNKV
ncbi:MAG: penicillin-binding transpeptidase domain-containing protein [Bacteroidaceae bacterium]